MSNWLWATVVVLAQTGAPPEGRPEVPRISGDWWTIAGNPDLTPLTGAQQEPVDFSIWQAADGTWQLWSCIRKTRCGGKSRLFHGWEGRALTDPDWRPLGIVMQADPKLGEEPGGLQAPHVVREPNGYHLFYGDWNHICHATGKDGRHFARQLRPDGTTGMFGEGRDANARDPMALAIDGQWHVYYTAHPHRQGRVYCRTSHDLRRWSEAKVVSFGGRGGKGPFAAECPHVVRRGKFLYLFRTEKYGPNNLTHVYRSTDPLNFGSEDDRHWIATLPVAAPEIVHHDGQDYLAALRLDLKGIRLARLQWEPVAK